MKNIRQYQTNKRVVIMGLLLTGSLLGACTKDKKTETIPPAEKHAYSAGGNMRTVNLDQYLPNTMSWADIAKGTDPQDVLFRKAQLFLSIGLSEIVKDSTIAHWITSQTLTATDNVISFETVFNQFPGTKQLVEAVTDPYGVMTGWSFEQVQQQLQYDTFQIKASIFLANAAVADATYKPLCAAGFDLDLDDATQTSDPLLAWHLDDNNLRSRITIYQDIANLHAAPVLSMDGRAENVGETMKTTEETEGPKQHYPPTTDHPNMRVAVTKFRITQRYDVSASSEMRIVGRCVFSNGGGGREFLSDNCDMYGRRETEKKFDKVHKSDIGKTFSKDFYFARAHSPWPLDLWFGEYDHNYITAGGWYILNNRKLLFYNTFEWDWGVSEKPLSPTTIRFGSGPELRVDLKGRMTKYYEWYLNNPMFPRMLQLPYPYIVWTRAQTADDGKGEMELKINSHCTY